VDQGAGQAVAAETAQTGQETWRGAARDAEGDRHHDPLARGLAHAAGTSRAVADGVLVAPMPDREASPSASVMDSYTVKAPP
jgi:hypothetical protein